MCNVEINVKELTMEKICELKMIGEQNGFVVENVNWDRLIFKKNGESQFASLIKELSKCTLW